LKTEGFLFPYFPKEGIFYKVMDSRAYMVFEELLLGAVSGWLLIVLVAFMIWDTVWKGIGLWKSGRNNQLAWFVCILIFNTIGILPIIYILFFQKRKK